MGLRGTFGQIQVDTDGQRKGRLVPGSSTTYSGLTATWQVPCLPGAALLMLNARVAVLVQGDRRLYYTIAMKHA